MKRTFTTDFIVIFIAIAATCLVYGAWSSNVGGARELVDWAFSGVGQIWKNFIFALLGIGYVTRTFLPYYKKTRDTGGALVHILPDVVIIVIIGAMATQLGWVAWNSALFTIPLFLTPPMIGAAIATAILRFFRR